MTRSKSSAVTIPVSSISKKLIKRIAPAAVITALLALSGCATMSTGELENTAPRYLPSSASVYAYLSTDDPDTSPQVLSDAFDLPPAMEKVADRVDRMFLSVDVTADEPVFTAVAVGRIPETAIGLGLTFDRSWKRLARRSWIDIENGLRLWIPVRDHLVFSNDGFDGIGLRDGAPPVQLLDAIGEFGDDSQLIAVTSDPASLAGLNLPAGMAEIERAVFSGEFLDQMIAGDVIVDFSSAAVARLAGVLVRAVIIAESRSESVGPLEGSEVRIEETRMILGPVKVDPAELDTMIGGEL